MPNFFLILSASVYLTLDSFCSSAMMEMFVVSFVISSSILSLHVFLGWRPERFLGAQSTMSVMAHAVAYSRLLISVMLRSCPCLMLFRAKFARFSRISPPLLLIFTFGTGFLFFMGISLIIALFFWQGLPLLQFSRPLGGCPIFLLVSSFGIFSRFGGGCIGSNRGSSEAWTLFVHLILSRISWSSVEVSFCCLSIPPLAGQVFSVHVGFGISVLIAANFVSLGGFVFTW